MYVYVFILYFLGSLFLKLGIRGLSYLLSFSMATREYIINIIVRLLLLTSSLSHYISFSYDDEIS